MQNLEVFEMESGGVESIPANIQWSHKIAEINFRGNRNLKLIEEYAFTSASGLTSLLLEGSSDGLQVRSNAFHKKQAGGVLRMGTGIFESNAFGNVDGGELWGSLHFFAGNDFPEDVFRLMIKTAFDKNHDGKYNTI